MGLLVEGQSGGYSLREYVMKRTHGEDTHDSHKFGSHMFIWYTIRHHQITTDQLWVLLEGMKKTGKLWALKYTPCFK